MRSSRMELLALRMTSIGCSFDWLLTSIRNANAPSMIGTPAVWTDKRMREDDMNKRSSACGSLKDRDMTIDDFRQSLVATEPPAELAHALAGLWWDRKGDWNRAHESAQQDEGPEGSWVHAYLHRKEGDQGNAAFWYRRAGKAVCREQLDEEWLGIVKGLLG
jgi:hypothetical protein